MLGTEQHLVIEQIVDALTLSVDLSKQYKVGRSVLSLVCLEVGCRGMVFYDENTWFRTHTIQRIEVVKDSVIITDTKNVYVFRRKNDG